MHLVDTHTVDGSWGPWRTGQCSVTCGVGSVVRTRECNNPLPVNGGKDCVGPSSEVQPCNEGCCPGIKSCSYILLHTYTSYVIYVATCIKCT